MSENKIYSFIGLARKAGAVILGEALSVKAVRQGKAHLAIIALDASENTTKKIETALFNTNIPMARFGSREELGQILGKPFISVLTVTDKGFAKRLQEMIYDINKNNSTHGGGVFE
ncbi:MAG: 50S ribosomal protein L7ae [Clostridiaceae bacterium]|nr:50S ribosomal protein L7ae [Clostridiaceae bacterium]